MDMEKDAFDRLLGAFERYYNVKKNDVESPFCAEAEFHSHTEQYFLVKDAKLSESDSNEFVFFCNTTELNDNNLVELCQTAWSRALDRVVPGWGHRNSDVSVIILSEKIDQNTLKLAKKINFYKSYKFGFWGFSRLKLIAAELSTGRLCYNRFGADYKKTLNNIL